MWCQPNISSHTCGLRTVCFRPADLQVLLHSSHYMPFAVQPACVWWLRALALIVTRGVLHVTGGANSGAGCRMVVHAAGRIGIYAPSRVHVCTCSACTWELLLLRLLCASSRPCCLTCRATLCIPYLLCIIAVEADGRVTSSACCTAKVNRGWGATRRFVVPWGVSGLWVGAGPYTSTGWLRERESQ